MKRQYKVKQTGNSSGKNDIKVIRFVSAVTAVFIFAACYVGITARADTVMINSRISSIESVSAASVSEPAVSVSADVQESTIASMFTAGNYMADIQNRLIAENDKYCNTVRNAAASGYGDTVEMTDEYKSLIASAYSKYMKSKPANVSSVIWSDYGVWEFNCDYDYSAEKYVTMPAVWTCYDASDTKKLHPYAVVTATYVTATDEFTDAELSLTEWYPDNDVSLLSAEALKAGMPTDPTVCADQCADISSGDKTVSDDMTDDQKEVTAELQKQLDAQKASGSVTISH